MIVRNKLGINDPSAKNSSWFPDRPHCDGDHLTFPDTVRFWAGVGLPGLWRADLRAEWWEWFDPEVVEKLFAQ